MHVFESQAKLNEPIHNFSFLKRFTLSLLLTHVISQISFLAKFHYYDQDPFFDERMFI